MEALTAEAAAEILKVSTKTVIGLIKDGRLAGNQIGDGPRSHWRTSDVAIAEFLGVSLPEVKSAQTDLAGKTENKQDGA